MAVCSSTSVVCFYRDVTICLKLYACIRQEHVHPKRRTREDKMASPPCRRLYRSHVAWPAPKRKTYLAKDKIKCADVFENTKHVISLSNRFAKPINLLTSTTFCFMNEWVMVPLFLVFFAPHGHRWPFKKYSN